MVSKQTRVVLLIGASLYMSAVAFAGGVAAERIRLDRHREAVLPRHDAAAQLLMAAERRAERKAEAGSAAVDAAQAVR